MTDWKFLVDENLSPQIAETLRKEGIDAEHIKTSDGIGLGASDTDLREFCRTQGRIIVTNDPDFRNFPVDDHAGVVMVHDDAPPATELGWALLALVEEYDDPGHLAYDVLDNYQ